MMSQYSTDVETLNQRVVDTQLAAAHELEKLRIAQAHLEIKFNMAIWQIIEDYFAGEPLALQFFEEAYAIESLPNRQTLRNMIEGSTQTPAQHNQVLRSLTHQQLQQKAREEAAVKQANQKNPAVLQVEPGAKILPAYVDKRWVKNSSPEEIRSARIRFDREHGQGAFNLALTARLNNQDKNELRRLYGLGE